jgi:CxxC motif-containing protein (DUF1111 family)
MTLRISLLFGLTCFAAAGVADAAPDVALVTANTGRSAFAQPFAFIEDDALTNFRSGANLFRLPWFADENGGQARFGGLGPLSNRFSCLGCHIGNGRGETSTGEADVMRSALVRLSILGADANGAPLPEPSYGDQLQPTGIYGVLGEGEASIRWHELEETLADGTRISLRRPELVLSRLHYGPVSPETMTSVRMSPGVFGLGLLAAVPDEELILHADPNDENRDGIRGRLNHVWNAESGRTEIGRFGLKANQPTLRQQIAAALISDMGITSRIFRQQNCTPAEDACLRAPSGRAPDIGDDDLATLVSYVEALAPPAPRPGDKISERGAELFDRSGCSSCHLPSLRTGAGGAFPQAANRIINPYTDLLLHDMGEGLADGRLDFEASGRDWRTAPLWGIGLAGAAIEQPSYLHDGRARNLSEAILWHGGEAVRARNAFAALGETDRNAIVAFLGSL